MKKQRICTIFGTRPEAIKLAPVIRLLDCHPNVQQRVLVTGQHNELLHQMLQLFDIRPAQDFAVMLANHTLGTLTARVLQNIEQDLVVNRPDWVVVQGDTTTAMAASLASYYLRIPVAHIEAGLRTDDRYSPFPEEINRRFIDQLACLHFAPTERARKNLLREGIDSATIHVIGNTGIDALLEVARLDKKLCTTCPRLRLLLVTAHRRENFGQELLNICAALRALVIRNSDVHVIYVVHPNPNVSTVVRHELGGLPRIELVDALDYAHFIHLMKESFLILTDSGGIQEEAPSLGKPVLVLRDCTERLEAVESGTAKLVGTNPNKIVHETELLLRNVSLYSEMAQTRNPYGDGHAAQRIVAILTNKSVND
jgi:UDP-N-acetylglucosamine 2-epimerase (non-hydrolysing)